MTTGEALALIEKRKNDIQDYYLVVTRSFYTPAYPMDISEQMAARRARDMMSRLFPESGPMAPRDVSETIQRMINLRTIYQHDLEGFSTSSLSGNVYALKGVGEKAYLYSIWSVISPRFHSRTQRMQEKLSSFSPPEPTWDRPNQHHLRAGQIMIRTPEATLNISPDEEETPLSLERNLYQPNRAASVRIEENHGDMSRSLFPFWHESILEFAENADAEIQPTPEGCFRLRIQPKEPPWNILAFEAILNDEGDVLEFVRIHAHEGAEEWVEFRAYYNHYVDLEPDGARLPMTGVMRYSERASEEHDVSMREQIVNYSVLMAELNNGYTLDDIAVTLPKGSIIWDYRPEYRERAMIDEEIQLSAEMLAGRVVYANPNQGECATP